MTKKDYELIARIISKLPDWRINKVGLAAEFCKALESDDPRFKPGEFIAASLGLDFKDLDAVAAERSCATCEYRLLNDECYLGRATKKDCTSWERED